MLLRPINFAFVIALAAGCSQAPQPTAQIDNTHRAMSKPLVLSSKPARDAAAYNASEEKLEEADWQLLQTLGPKAVWDKINDKSRAAKNRPASTQPASPMFAPTTNASKTPEPAPVIPVITTPDGKIRIVYQLRHYGGSSVTTTVDGGTSRRNVVMKAPDLAPLVAVMVTQIGAAGIVAPLANENKLIITCDPAMKDSVLQLLSKIDEAPRQVEINAKMFEVSHDFDFQYGAKLILNHIADDNVQQLASTFSTKRFIDAVSTTASGGAAPEGAVLRLMKVFQEAGISVDGTFQLMQDSGLITVVASPRMTVAAGQTGYMLAGQELPIQSQSIVNSAQQTTTTYKPVGVQLYITPQAMGHDSVKLHAISIVSAVSGFAPLPTLSSDTQPAQKLINPIIDSREAETTVTIDDGNTLVFGGLRMIRTTARESKIPGLGDIPGLGWLFKNHRSQKQMTDLYFFVTPTLL